MASLSLFYKFTQYQLILETFQKRCDINDTGCLYQDEMLKIYVSPFLKIPKYSLNTFMPQSARLRLAAFKNSLKTKHKKKT